MSGFTGVCVPDGASGRSPQSGIALLVLVGQGTGWCVGDFEFTSERKSVSCLPVARRVFTSPAVVSRRVCPYPGVVSLYISVWRGLSFRASSSAVFTTCAHCCRALCIRVSDRACICSAFFVIVHV